MSDDGGSSAAREIEPFYAGLIEAAPDAVFVIEAGASQYLLVNVAAQRLVGYSRADLLRMGPVDILHPDELPRLPDVRRQFAEDGCWRGEWRLRRKDGSVVLVEATNSRHEIGGRIFHQGLFRDVTDRQRAHASLAHHAAQLAEAQRLAHLGSWEWEIGSDRQTWSDELYRIIGWEPRAAPLTHAALMERLHPDDRAHVLATVDAARRDDAPFEYEARITRQDGEARVVHCRKWSTSWKCLGRSLA